MDASELLTVAMDAMPLMVLEAADQGQVYGVLQMALRTLEAQHAALLAEADEETTEAKKLWREALAELDALKVDRDAVLAANRKLNEDLRNLKVKFDGVVDDARKARIAWGDAKLERNEARNQCDSMATEFDAKQRELEEVRSARDETIAGLQAENARLHRSLEERMTAHIPGAVQVAKTEELHGMADVYAQSQRMSNAITPSKPVHLVPAGSEDL